MLQIINDIAELEQKEEVLGEAYRKHSCLSFCSPAFLFNAYQEFLSKEQRNQLYFVIYAVKEEIVAYLPLYIDAAHTLKFIFDRHTDYCGIVGQQPDIEFFKEFAKQILSEPKIKRLDFDNLLPNDGLLNYLKQFFNSGIIASSYNNHSYVSAEKDKGYFGTLKSKFRSELKRVQGKTSNYAFKTFTHPEDFPVQKIQDLRNHMIQSGLRDQSFFDEQFISFSKKMYEAGEMILISKWDQNELLSIVFVFSNQHQKSFTFWITLFNDRVQYINLSTYLDFISQIEHQEPYRFSFGRGNYDFKLKFLPVIENLYNLRYSKSKWDFFFVNFYPIKLFLKRLIREKK
ncbi:hypothetical protein LPB86_01550 [Pedobacter sp. MC2016-14]|uniref:hypothetical protein n=1 Tax=Pedobacter sp. MC2016-14 TaxID=2897327 RepID=UPI001E64A109|nr:hypothetical protein [Pedobacter sp. MC2016-14]MCD0486894.1 hypothetical protein [Pedobacter sp. MC2016-14]